MEQAIAPKAILGDITDALGDQPILVRSSVEGWVNSHNQNPLIHQGDALVHIAKPITSQASAATTS